MKGFKFILLGLAYCALMAATCNQRNVVEKLLKEDALLTKIYDKEAEYEVQIRYTQIDRNNDGQPRFTSYDYNVDPKYYFYPASSVKMPIAILAMQKIRALAKETGKDLSINSPMYHFASRPPQSDYVLDEVTGKVPTIADYVNQIFCVSDNNAYNRLFEFLGANYINETLYQNGAFTTSHIVHRVGISGFEAADHDYVNEVQFKDKHRNLIHSIPARKSIFLRKTSLESTQKGKGYMDGSDSLILKPFDFSKKNYFSIIDLEACLKRVIFPETFPSDQRFNLEKEDYDFLKKAMYQLPSALPYYQNDEHYYDTYVKYFFDGDSTSIIPPHVKIYNKVGCGYGYLTDCSYYTDEKAGIEFLLTATLKVNEDGIFNDGKYEYETVGLPFFRALGKAVLKIEKERKR